MGAVPLQVPLLQACDARRDTERARARERERASERERERERERESQSEIERARAKEGVGQWRERSRGLEEAPFRDRVREVSPCVYRGTSPIRKRPPP